MKAIVLTDNIACGDMQGEWGLSVFIEYEGHNILLDTGETDLFIENAEKTGIDLSTVDALVLSHAHYDHGNGIDAFFEKNDRAPCYMRKTAGENCYLKKGPIRKYIGLKKGLLTEHADRIVFADGDVKLYPGCFLIPHKTNGLENIGKGESMYRKESEGWIPDDFSHEQSLVFDTEKGLVIFNSCSHGGAANIIEEVQKTFPEKNVYGMIGGFHLFNKKKEDVIRFAQAVKDTGIEYICTGHCTGDKAYLILKDVLGEKLCQLHVSLEMNF